MSDDIQFAREFLRRLGITNFDRIQEAVITITATKHAEKCEIKLKVDTEPENMTAFRMEQYTLVRKSTKPDGVPEDLHRDRSGFKPEPRPVKPARQEPPHPYGSYGSRE